MPRVYHRKPDRKDQSVNIPVSRDLMDRLQERAEKDGKTKTETARRFLVEGLAR